MKRYIVIDHKGEYVATCSTRRKAICKARRDHNGGAIGRTAVRERILQTHNLKPIGVKRQPGTHGLAGRFGMRELPYPQRRAMHLRTYGAEAPLFHSDEMIA